MYYGGGLNGTNEQNKPLDHDFVSLLLKGRTDSFALKGGDATTGKFSTMYDGARPIRPHQKGIKNHGYQVSCTRWHPHPAHLYLYGGFQARLFGSVSTRALLLRRPHGFSPRWSWRASQ